MVGSIACPTPLPRVAYPPLRLTLAAEERLTQVPQPGLITISSAVRVHATAKQRCIFMSLFTPQNCPDRIQSCRRHERRPFDGNRIRTIRVLSTPEIFSITDRHLVQDARRLYVGIYSDLDHRKISVLGQLSLWDAEPPQPTRSNRLIVEFQKCKRKCGVSVRKRNEARETFGGGRDSDRKRDRRLYTMSWVRRSCAQVAQPIRPAGRWNHHSHFKSPPNSLVSQLAHTNRMRTHTSAFPEMS